MKEIKPVVFPLNLGTATIFNLIGINDNLVDNATFVYQLFTIENTLLQSGNLTMDGQDYIDYSSSPDSNTFAYNWCATKLNITIIS